MTERTLTHSSIRTWERLIATITPTDLTDPPMVRTFTPQQVGIDWTWRHTAFSISGRGQVGAINDYDKHFSYDYDAKGNLQHVYGELSGTQALVRFHESNKTIAPPPPKQSVDINSLLLASSTVDFHGNVIEVATPNARCTQYAYDTPYAQLRPTTTIYTTTCNDSANALETAIHYRREFNTADLIMEPTGAIAVARYDDRGRPQDISQPDPANIGNTILDVIVDHNDQPQGSYHWTHVLAPGRETYLYFDAADTLAFTLNRADPTAGDQAPWILSGNVVIDTEQSSVAFQPSNYFGSPTGISSTLATTSPSSSRITVDEYGRPVGTYALDGTLLAAMAYHALATDRKSEAGNVSTIERNGHGLISTAHQHVGGDDLQLRYRYGSTGEAIQIQQTHTASADSLTRWIQYDSLGRRVANIEPNTGDASNYWRYAYDDDGEVVGTSDARGCGENLFYDGAGRLRAGDLSPCLDSQSDYTPPDTQLINGTEAAYLYDANGRLSAVFDRGAADALSYDGRDRTIQTRRLVARPGPTANQLTDRYEHHVSQIEGVFDDANRLATASTGADVPELLGNNASSTYTLALQSERGRLINYE